MNKLNDIFQDNGTVRDFASAYLQYVGAVISKISVDEIASFVEVLLLARERESSIYFIGNGGSASTASHFANDLAIGTKSWDKPFRAVSLCDNHSVITALANDYGYDQIFIKQLGYLLNKNDVVVAISASGNSENLIKGLDFAKNKGATTVGLTSFDGGKLREISDISVHVPAEKGEYGPAEDGHMIIDHLVGSYLMRLLEKNE